MPIAELEPALAPSRTHVAVDVQRRDSARVPEANGVV